MTRAIADAFIRTATFAIGIELAGLATLWTVLQSPTTDPNAARIARQELRLQAAQASRNAKPLIGESHLPPYDTTAAIAREEAALQRLLPTRNASR